jgi:prophage DNA circulation protein
VDIDQLHPGSYKGVPFLLASGTVGGGNKNAIHSYINSNKQTVENLGQTPRSFPLNIIIPSTNYISARDRLLAVLEDGAPGPLVHPFYGRVDNIIAGPYTLSESMTELGDGKLSVTMYVDNGPDVPVQEGTTVNTVAAAKDAALDGTEANMAAEFSVTPALTGNLTAATDLVADAALAFKNLTSPLDDVQALLNAADDLANEAAALVLAPVNLARSVRGMVDQVTTVFENPLRALEQLENLFTFGDNGTTTPPVTAGQIERASNTATFNDTVQAQALAAAYFMASQVDFATVAEVESVNDRLDVQFDKAYASNGIDDASKDLLSDVKATANDLFDQAKLTAKRVVLVSTKLTSARLLAFNYYGNDDQGEDLQLLNNLSDVNAVEGTVQVLTE